MMQMTRDPKSGFFLPERKMSRTDERSLIASLGSRDVMESKGLMDWWTRVSGLSGGMEGYAGIPMFAASAQVDGPQILNSTTRTTMLPAHARWNVGGGLFDKVGKWLRIQAGGRISCVVTTPGTFTMDIAMGPTANIIVFNGGAMPLNIVAKTNVTWRVEIDLILRAIGNGTTANFLGMGTWQSEAAVGAPAGAAGAVSMPASAPAVGTGFDSTVAMIMDMFGTFSVNTATTSETLHHFMPMLMN